MIYLVIFALLVASGGAVWYAAYSLGRQKAVSKELESNVEAAKRIANVPDTDDTVLLDQLRDGKRKL